MKRFGILEIVLLVVGGLFLWNTWIFGLLNHGTAGYTQMSISELNVAGQPYAAFFSITEGLSGLLLLVGGLGLIVPARKDMIMILVLALTASIGALTIFDATHPVDCNQYQNPACVAKMKTGQVSKSTKEHGIESTITDYATVALALILVLWAIVHKKSGEITMFELLMVIIVALGVIAFLVVRIDNVAFNSIAQRLWNTFVSFDFAYIAYKLYPLLVAKNRKARGFVLRNN